MPEIISKYPELTITVLKKATMNCGTGAKQTILTTCPKDRFCTLANGKGELCIYAPSETGSMTQVNSFDFISFTDLMLPVGSLAIFIFLAGMAAGMKLK